jgi:hypothetical protein
MRRPTLLVVSLLGSLAACTEDDTSLALARLQPVADCGAAKQYIKEVAIAQMNKRIDQQIASYQFGGACNNGGGDDTTGAGSGGGSGSGTSPPPGPSHGTGTNNQVSGVDEADFIKNDGQYIYLAQNGVFRIVSSWPADQTHIVSTTALTGTPKKLFVLGDRALVYTSSAPTDSYYRECTYGYDCDFTGDGSTTTLLVYDITDRSAPHLDRQIELSGSLIAGRRIGSAVHTVVTQSANLFPDVSYNPDIALCGTSGFDFVRVSDAFLQLRNKNRELIENTDLDLALPTVTDSAGLTTDGDGSSCSSLLTSSFSDGTGFTSLVSIDLDHPGPVKTATVISRSGAVYASEDSLYMAVPHSWNEKDVSTVHKFRVSDVAGQTKYLASGLVTGRVLNQFSMDEQDGILRIATTDGHDPDPDVVSYLSTLEQQHDDLVKIGQVGGIAPHEDIRSVRFDGNRGFIVTFKKTDPLYVFDLSNPHAPAQLGELQIPGFSTYMHMLDDTHLLTIGYNANDEGSFAWFDGVLLQIFDVTDPRNPVLAQKYLIGTRGSSSEALTDHLAFTWYPEQGLLSLPMTICEGGGNGVYGDTLTFSGLMVFNTSIDTGFSEHGRIPHTIGSGESCGNWWTDATSVVKRSLFLDRFVYSLSDAELKVRSIDALSTELVTVPLQ